MKKIFFTHIFVSVLFSLIVCSSARSTDDDLFDLADDLYSSYSAPPVNQTQVLPLPSKAVSDVVPDLPSVTVVSAPIVSIVSVSTHAQTLAKLLIDVEIPFTVQKDLYTQIYTLADDIVSLFEQSYAPLLEKFSSLDEILVGLKNQRNPSDIILFLTSLKNGTTAPTLPIKTKEEKEKAFKERLQKGRANRTDHDARKAARASLPAPLSSHTLTKERTASSGPTVPTTPGSAIVSRLTAYHRSNTDGGKASTIFGDILPQSRKIKRTASPADLSSDEASKKWEEDERKRRESVREEEERQKKAVARSLLINEILTKFNLPTDLPSEDVKEIRSGIDKIMALFDEVSLTPGRDPQYIFGFSTPLDVFKQNEYKNHKSAESLRNLLTTTYTSFYGKLHKVRDKLSDGRAEHFKSIQHESILKTERPGGFVFGDFDPYDSEHSNAFQSAKARGMNYQLFLKGSMREIIIMGTVLSDPEMDFVKVWKPEQQYEAALIAQRFEDCIFFLYDNTLLFAIVTNISSAPVRILSRLPGYEISGGYMQALHTAHGKIHSSKPKQINDDKV
ncbi:MAG: hypothetical protein FJX71_03405 [Alphaproteobacteria bacterium]|nr:hypothetical protein [Alphaproteobacteria bacterium]